MDRTTGGLGVVVNPRVLHGPRAGLWTDALARLRAARAVTCVETAGDGRDRERIAGVITAARPDVIVAAGGDGTVREVAQALYECSADAAPALAVLPFGTANNVARSLGLRSLRARQGSTALEHALAAALAGRTRAFDLGRVGTQVFAGAFAIGMDGAILADRNRWRRDWRLGPRTGGYALYLLSCAVNLARQRRVAGCVTADGRASADGVYNVLVTNIPLYAGEFRFDADDHSADGRLDLHVFNRPRDYVRAFAAAWRRHLRHGRGMAVEPPPSLRRIARVHIALSSPLPNQLDGEELPATAEYEVCVVPNAIRVCVPGTPPPS